MCALVAQRIEQLPSKQWVVGSIPSRGTIFLPSFYAQADLSCKNLQKGAKICTFRKKLRHDYGTVHARFSYICIESWLFFRPFYGVLLLFCLIPAVSMA